MEEWKFLVQKDGDRSWLPLDSPDVEILEGRYRIVARFAQANTEVHIRICHLAIAEDPPKRRLQKRFSQTNANGLMVVVPYTYLSPGIWDFSCFSPDPMSHLMGDTLHHSIRLQVFAPVLDQGEDWDWDGDESNDVDVEIESTSSPETRSSGMENNEIEPNNVEESALLEVAEAPTTPEIVALNVEIAQALGLSMDRLVAMTEQLSHQLIEEVFREFGTVPSASQAELRLGANEPMPELAIEQDLEPQPPTTLGQVDARAVQIILEQEAFQASVGQSVTVAGRLMLQDRWQIPKIALRTDNSLDQAQNDGETDLDGAILDGAIAASTQWIAQELRISFRNPQDSEVIFSNLQSLTNEQLPHAFSFTVELPAHLTTHLLIGEIELWGSASEQAEPIALQSATVTVTMNPEELMAEFQRVRTALDQEPDDSDLSDLAVEFSERLHRSKTKPVLDLSFLDLTATNLVAGQDRASTQEISALSQTARSQGLGLPPQLSEPQTDSTGIKRKLDLPEFIVTTRTTTSATAVQEAIAQETIVEELNEQVKSAEAGHESEAAVTEAIRETLSPGIAVSELTEKEQDSDVDSEVMALIEQLSIDAAKAADTPTVVEKPSPIKSAFQALRLQDRFLERLSVLAADEELLVALKEIFPPETTTESNSVTAEETLTQTPAEDWVTHEVVVDDDPMWQEWMRRSLSRAKRGEALELPCANPLMMPEDEAIPVPIIEILTDEIVAGRPMNVRLKLPNLLPKIYIKLWVNDCQTRSLLDGPRWMVDFFPNGHDELEAVTQLTVPFGTLAIRLEAIAVEVQTQRESQKTSFDCEVIPPDFLELPLEDFNF
ncbi:hypothetical protein JOY44_17865 [Phormidium sp. CLA17]|uniref:hypothetical protein n=1 Tax=Leptolyngbya sp. Cla-17 TaxID=2803751 RepID=UPI0014910F00|nr:hypothetical protein [Leptolyngbya sp. Cla-17]MBM0743454.1 hypothetical protein [Leptolyngbya sp. Cla-17]